MSCCQVTGVVEQFNHSLPYGVNHAATTIVADTIYVFNANETNSNGTEWLSYYLGTTDPTADPTSVPTVPTEAPSQPTLEPTREPTNEPTAAMVGRSHATVSSSTTP